MTEYGISVYPDLKELSEIKYYIDLASSYGCKYVFSSMWSVEGSKEEIIAYFKDLGKYIQSKNMKLALDVNHQFLTKLEVEADDLSLFKEIGCEILRMDVPYGNENDNKLCQNEVIEIQFNASFMEGEYIDRLAKINNNVSVCHNFYPQRYTGMKWEKFLETNKQFNVPIYAFASSQNENTHGVWDARDGLPTVEMMRDYPLDLQARLLIKGGSDVVIIGNAYASEKELAGLKEVCSEYKVDENNPAILMMKKLGNRDELPEFENNILKIDLAEISEIERKILFEFYPHSDVGDSSEWIWRSRMPRYIYKNDCIEARKDDRQYFEVGDVLIVNDNYKHYAAEVQIALRPLINDGARNYVGHINNDEQVLLNLIKEREVIIFKERK